MDNLVEWIEKEQDKNDEVLRCLILVNINFILYHTIFYKSEKIYLIKGFYDKLKFLSNNFDSRTVVTPANKLKFYESCDEYLNGLEGSVYNDNQVNENKKFIQDNKKLYESKFYANKLNISKIVDDKTFQKINNFIETGIL